MSGAITRIERCVDASERLVTLTREECVALLALWVAANQTLAFHAPKVQRDEELSRPHRELRAAVKGLMET